MAAKQAATAKAKDDQGYDQKCAQLIAQIDGTNEFHRKHSQAEYVGKDPRYRYYTIGTRRYDGKLKEKHEDSLLRAQLKRKGYEPDPDGVTNSRVTHAEIWRTPKAVWEHRRARERERLHSDEIWLASNMRRSTPGQGFVDHSLIPDKIRKRMEQ
jgi:hypothetical protein